MDEINDSSQWWNVIVTPQPSILYGVQAGGHDGCGFHGDEAGATEGELAKVDEVVVGHEAVLAAILTHGGDEDAIGKGYVADCEGGGRLG